MDLLVVVHWHAVLNPCEVLEVLTVSYLWWNTVLIMYSREETKAAVCQHWSRSKLWELFAFLSASCILLLCTVLTYYPVINHILLFTIRYVVLWIILMCMQSWKVQLHSVNTSFQEFDRKRRCVNCVGDGFVFTGYVINRVLMYFLGKCIMHFLSIDSVARHFISCGN